MVLLKKLLVYSLLLSLLAFLLFSFSIPPAKAATLNRDPAWHDKCVSGATPISTGDLPFDVSKFINFNQDKSTITKQSEGQYKIHLEWQYGDLSRFNWEPGGAIVGGKNIPIKTWSRDQVIKGTKGDFPVGSATKYDGTIAHNADEQAVFRLQSQVCWTADIKVRINPFVPGNPLTYFPLYKMIPKDFKHDFISDGLTLDPNANTGKPEIGQGGEGGTLPGGDGSSTPTTAVGGVCEERCKSTKALYGTLPTISSAICEGQCYLISAMSALAGEVIQEVLLPSLGIDEDRR